MKRSKRRGKRRRRKEGEQWGGCRGEKLQVEKNKRGMKRRRRRGERGKGEDERGRG